MEIVKYILIIICISWIYSCNFKTPLDLDSEPKLVDSTKLEINPLAYGNLWTYDMRVIDKGVTKDFIETHSVVDTLRHNEQKVYKYVIKSGDFEFDYFSFNTDSGLYYTHKFPFFVLQFPFPTTIGLHHIVGPFRLKGVDHILRRTLVEKNVAIIVPAGSFKCYKYIDELIDQVGTVVFSPLRETYYTPNRGLIKEVGYRINSQSSDIDVYYQKDLVSINFK